eukprot:11647011-Alexandrium_andersonii.AAC.1
MARRRSRRSPWGGSGGAQRAQPRTCGRSSCSATPRTPSRTLRKSRCRRVAFDLSLGRNVGLRCCTVGSSRPVEKERAEVAQGGAGKHRV